MISKSTRGLFGSGVIAAVSASVICPEDAFAASGVEAILPQMNEFIPMLIAFLILWFVLAKFGWPYFEKMLSLRENTIQDALKKSAAAQEESERLLEEHKKQLDEAKAQAASIVTEAKKTAESVQKDLTARAQQEADDMIVKAQTAIEAQKKQAIAELQASVADMSIAVASRLIGDDLNDDQHRDIVERYVKEAGSFNDS